MRELSSRPDMAGVEPNLGGERCSWIPIRGGSAGTPHRWATDGTYAEDTPAAMALSTLSRLTIDRSA